MDLQEFARKLAQFDFEQVVNDAVFAKEQLIIDLNQSQLQQGERTTGHKIRTYAAVSPNVYANLTIAIKKDKGQPTNAVTLKDSGIFYKSFELEAEKDGWNVNADWFRDGEDIRKNVSPENVLGLNERNKAKLNEAIKPDIQQACRQALGL